MERVKNVGLLKRDGKGGDEGKAVHIADSLHGLLTAKQTFCLLNVCDHLEPLDDTELEALDIGLAPSTPTLSFSPSTMRSHQEHQLLN